MSRKKVSRPSDRNSSHRRQCRLESLESRRLLAGDNPIVLNLIGDQPPTMLISALLDSSAQISVVDGSASYVGNGSQAASFAEFDFTDASGTRLQIDDGILLTSGDANEILSNIDGSQTGITDTGTDTDLANIVNDFVFDANTLEFEFTVAPDANSIQFDFLFGSEEFPEFVNRSVNDVAAVYLDGVQIAFDAQSRPLTVDNNFFILNNSGVTAAEDPDAAGKINVDLPLVGYDGITPRLTTTAPLNKALSVHHIKFAIADVGDSALDSGFLVSNLRASTTQVMGPTTGNSISGVKYSDDNDNGFQDPLESVVPGVTIYVDANNNGVLDADERSSTSAADGTFEIDSLPPDTYIIRQADLNVVPPVYYPGAVIVTLPAGENISNLNIGNLNDLSGDYSLDVGAPIYLGSFISSVAQADLNLDGFVDLIVAEHYTSASELKSDLAIIWGSASAATQSSSKMLLPLQDGDNRGLRPQDVFVGDFNNDQWPDIAVAVLGSSQSDGGVLVKLGSASGFDPQSAWSPTSVSGGLTAMVAGDFNNDMYLDLALTNFYSASVAILIGDGQGGFATAQTIGVGNRPTAIAVGDLNADGELDLAVANHGSNSVSLLAGSGLGTFSSIALISDVPAPAGLAVGRFDSDAYDDLAVSGSDVRIYSGGNLSVPDPNIIDSGQTFRGISAADVDNDGDLDLMAANSSGQAISLYSNFGGVFSPGSDFAVPEIHQPNVANAARVDPSPKRLAVADFNGDNVLDVAAAHFLRGISVHYGALEQAPTSGIISGVAWSDTNGNAMRESNESGLSNVTIYADLNGNLMLDSGDLQTNTSADGSYSLPIPGPGTYAVHQVVPAQYEQTFPISTGGHVVVFDGQPLTTGYDFGNLPPATVSLTVVPMSMTEGSSGAVTLTLSTPVNHDVIVDLAYSGTATFGFDYLAQSQVTIPAGATATTFSLIAEMDSEAESSESVVIEISAVDGGVESGAQSEVLTIIDYLVGASGEYQNAANRFDVNADGNVTPIDALAVLNSLTRGTLAGEQSSNRTKMFVDVNGDGHNTPVDALMIINQLSRSIRPLDAEAGHAMALHDLLSDGDDDDDQLLDTIASDVLAAIK